MPLKTMAISLECMLILDFCFSNVSPITVYKWNIKPTKWYAKKYCSKIHSNNRDFYWFYSKYYQVSSFIFEFE